MVWTRRPAVGMAGQVWPRRQAFGGGDPTQRRVSRASPSRAGQDSESVKRSQFQGWWVRSIVELSDINLGVNREENTETISDIQTLRPEGPFGVHFPLWEVEFPAQTWERPLYTATDCCTAEWSREGPRTACLLTLTSADVQGHCLLLKRKRAAKVGERAGGHDCWNFLPKLHFGPLVRPWVWTGGLMLLGSIVRLTRSHPAYDKSVPKATRGFWLALES